MLTTFELITCVNLCKLIFPFVVGLGTSAGLGVTSQTGSKFQVFCDENAEPSVIPKQTGEWNQLGARNVVKKENEQKPGPWNKSKVRSSV